MGQLDDYCKEKGFAGWFETSAKENIGIDEAARCLVAKVMECLIIIVVILINRYLRTMKR